MSRTPTRPVQVRLPEEVDAFLTTTARQLGESKTEVVIEALACLRRQLVERHMEEGYRELAAHPDRESEEYVRASLAATLPTVPD